MNGSGATTTMPDSRQGTGKTWRDPVSDRYAEAGVWSPIAVLDASEVAALRAQIQVLETCLGAPLTYLEWSHLFFPWSYRLVTHPRVVAAATAVLGPDLLVQGSLMLAKPPRSRGHMSWHQDGTHTTYPDGQATSAWIALTPSHRHNGCMQILPGSHQTRLPFRTVHHPDNLAKHATAVDRAVAPDEVWDLELQPGEMSLHHPLLVHGSQANHSDQARIGFIVRFSTPQTRVADPVVPVSGAGDYRHLRLAGPPTAANLAEQVDAWQAFLARRQAAQQAPDRGEEG